ncbi:MAG: hypothetical protein R3B70_44360, partial [Polyangiaceae bacterium]
MSARPTRPKKRRDFGRVVAVILCVLFAIIGAVPLLLGVLVRTSVVRSWVADRTEVLIARELGVAATYEIEVEAWPMRVALLDLTVDASDGGPAFLRVERATARPRLFSLLAGELDVGEIQIDRPWIRAVLREGELTNLRYRLPPSDPSKPASLPFSSLAVTEARVDLVVDETRVLTQELDADVSVEPGNKLEIALHVGGATVTRTHPTADWPDEDAVDEDRICALEARARIEGDEILLRRLNISGSADFDPDPGTVPPCALPSGDWRAFEVAISALRVTGFTALAPRGSGRIHAKLPPAVAHRFVKLPHLTGSITLDAEAEYTGGRLPIVTGKITADSPGADGKVFAETLSAQLTVTDSAAILTNLQAVWGSGKVHIAEAKVEPFSPGKKLTAGPVHIEGIDFPDLIRDLGVHPQATVGWSIKKADLPSFGGTLDPLDLEGDLTAQTEDFAVYDRSARRPERRRMIGLEEAKLHGTFAIDQEGVSFKGFTVDSPRSVATHLATTVTISFKNKIDLTVSEGSSVDLTEITPLVDIPISGIAKVKAVMRGTLTRPKLTGDVSITDFVFGGLPVGLVESAKAEFEPLKLTVTEARIRKGTSVVKVPRARFAFDEGPAVLVEADIDTREPPYLDVHDLLDIFQMDKLPHDGRMIPDPRWSEIQARTAGTARIRFVAGGPEDRCGGGVLRVDGDMRLLRAQLYGETYDEGDVDFLLVWDDKRAGANGMKLDVRSAILRKGSGAITATALVRHGGVLRAQALAAGIPIQSLDILGEYGDKFDGSINAVARIGGRLDAMNGLIDVEVSRVRVGPATLPPSRFEVQILPRRADSKPPAEGADDAELQRALQRTCGGSAGSPYDYNRFLSDPTDGDYVVNGALFGGQVEMHEVKISQQRRKVVRGAVEIKDLDLGA